MPGMIKPDVVRPSAAAQKKPQATDEAARRAQEELAKETSDTGMKYDPSADDDLAGDVTRTEGEQQYQTETAQAPDVQEPVKTPREKWLARIEEVGLTEEEAATICSEQLDPGYSERTYTRMSGRLVVVLRTRDAAHRSRLRYALDNLTNPTQTVVNETVLYQCLASSLVSIRMPKKTITFPHAKPGADTMEVEKAYRERMIAVDSLGEQVLEICFKLISDFDRMVGAAMSEGATEGF